MRILIADDTTIERVLLEKLLKNMGHEVVSTSDGEEALERFKEGSFPMVMLDWMMPKMDGIEACKRIREMDPTNREYCYIMMVTSKTEKENYLEAMQAGADDFISKPVDKQSLSVRMRTGERILDFNRRLTEKNRELEALQVKLKEHNVELSSQIEDLRTRIREEAPPEDTLDTPYDALDFGEVHLIECLEGDSGRAFDAFMEDVTHGVPGIILTREHPQKVKERYNLQSTEVIWLTKGMSKDKAGAFIPLNILAIEEEEGAGGGLDRNLKAVLDIVGDFISAKGRCVVLLDGIEYLFTRFSSSQTMDMLYDLNDMVKRGEGKAIVAYHPDTLEKTTVSILKKEMNWIPARR